jgi:hypothetical protein
MLLSQLISSAQIGELHDHFLYQLPAPHHHDPNKDRGERRTRKETHAADASDGMILQRSLGPEE